MLPKSFVFSFYVLGLSTLCHGQQKPASDLVELSLLKSYVGVWDAEAEVWPNGLDAESVKFKGVETNRPYGTHWLTSDFESVFAGQTTNVHAIVGYDLDREKLVGTVVDQGPYAAEMVGDYDPESKTIQWVTRVKAPDGTPITQKTTVTHTSDTQRLLVLSTTEADDKTKFRKFMEITYTKRK